MARLQSAINTVLFDHGIDHLPIITTPDIHPSNKHELVCERRLPDLGVPRKLISLYTLERRSVQQTAPTRPVHPRKVYRGFRCRCAGDPESGGEPPLEDKSIDNLKRIVIVTTILLPSEHGFLTRLHAHINRFDDHRRVWRNLELSDQHTQGAKGVLHPQFMGLHHTAYWRAQKRSPTQITLGDPDEFIGNHHPRPGKGTQNQYPWLPRSNRVSNQFWRQL